MTVGGNPTTAPALTGVNPTGATKSYASITGTVCSVLSNTGAVTGLNTGSCTIRLTLSNTGYVNTTNDYTFTVSPGTIVIGNWGNYNPVTVGGNPVSAPTLVGLNPTNAGRNYVSTTTGLCSVNPTTGAVTGIDDGTCGVKLTLSQTGYTEKSHNYSVTVNEGTFTTITWANFPSSVTIGSTTGDLGSPASDPAADTYDISVKVRGIVLGIILPERSLLQEGQNVW